MVVSVQTAFAPRLSQPMVSDMSGVTDPKPTLVFLTFDRITASVLASAVSAGWPPKAGAAAAGAAVRWLGEDALAPALALVAVGGGEVARVAARARAEPHRWRAVYIRPELMIAAEALGEPWAPGSAAQSGWDLLRGLDRALKSLPAVRMEAVFAGGAALGAQLSDHLGPKPPGGSDCPPVEAAHYNAALAELLSPAKLADELAPAAPAPAAGRYAIGSGGPGLAFLGRGWQGPEPDFTWTAGSAASLLIPATPEFDRTCRLSGHLITDPGRPVRVALRVDGEDAATLVNVRGQGAQVSVELRLKRRRAGEVHRVNLAILHPVRPCDVGESSDNRELGLALAALELVDEVSPELTFLSDPLVACFLAQRRPRHVLVIGGDAAVSASAAGQCVCLGCLQALFTSAAAEDVGASVLRSGPQPVAPDLDLLADRLIEAGVCIDVAVLCDAASIARWFSVCDAQSSYAGANLILNTGTGYGCGLAFSRYVSRWAALVRMSDAVTVAETWAAP